MIGKGFVHGRFQPPHKEHVRYALEAKKRCDHLYIGLTNFDLWALGATPVAPHRANRAANPLSYFQRLNLWHSIMADNGVSGSEFTVVPFPIDRCAEEFEQFIPNEIHAFVTVLDQWNLDKNQKLRENGYEVTVLWDSRGLPREISGEWIRYLAKTGDESWRSLVPKCTLAWLDAYGFSGSFNREAKMPADGR